MPSPKKVTKMVKERYKNGSETKVAYLQAHTQSLTLKTQLYTARQQQSTLYYQLIAISGLTQKVSLEKRFIYPVSTHIPKGKGCSPQQLIIDAQKKLYQSHMALNSNSLRELDLFSSLEQEPDQSIIRVGVNIPLSINNDRSEERMLAKLRMHQAALDSRQLAHTLKARRSMLETTIRELSGQYRALEGLSRDQQELVSLLEEGYRIAKGSLFQLMTEKSKLIQTRKTLLQTYKTINLQKIELRFLQGDYNE